MEFERQAVEPVREPEREDAHGEGDEEAGRVDEEGRLGRRSVEGAWRW